MEKNHVLFFTVILCSTFFCTFSLGFKKKKHSATVNSFGSTGLGSSVTRKNNPLSSNKGAVGGALAAGMAAGVAGGLVADKISDIGENAVMSGVGYRDSTIGRRRRWHRNHKSEKSYGRKAKIRFFKDGDLEFRFTDWDEDWNEDPWDVFDNDQPRYWPNICGKLKVPEHGSMQCFGNPFITTCTSSCASKYRFAKKDNGTRTCYAHIGQWIGKEPFPKCVKKYKKSCTPEEFEECSSDLLKLSNHPDMYFYTERELKKLCRRMDNSLYCIATYVTKCFPKQKQMIFRSMTNGYMEWKKKICKSSVREKLLGHQPCLNSTRDQINLCSMNYLLHKDNITSPNLSPEQNTQRACCLFKYYKHCISHAVKSKCGNETVKFVNEVIHKSTAPIEINNCTNVECPHSLQLSQLPVSSQ